MELGQLNCSVENPNPRDLILCYIRVTGTAQLCPFKREDLRSHHVAT